MVEAPRHRASNDSGGGIEERLRGAVEAVAGIFGLSLEGRVDSDFPRTTGAHRR